MIEPIPILDLRLQHAPLRTSLCQGFERLLDCAGFIGGADVEAFESAFAKLCGTAHCVGVNSGTDALMLALKVLGVGPGDTVLLPTYTFIATAEAVSGLGATPRLTDVDPITYTVGEKELLAANQHGVKAVIPVHLYGQAADMAPINALAAKNGWQVIEDGAQAHGATYDGKPVGSLGSMAAFSFYPVKNLGAMGDAGAVVSHDLELMERLRRLSNHGRVSRYEHGEPGVNSRLDALQAMALTVKLPHLHGWNAARQRVAQWYFERLGDVSGLTLPRTGEKNSHVYHLFVVLAPERQRLLAALDAAHIGAAVHYPMPLHLQPAYKNLGHGPGDFPVSESLAEQCISLPMYPELTEVQVDRVAAVLRQHMSAGA